MGGGWDWDPTARPERGGARRGRKKSQQTFTCDVTLEQDGVTKYIKK